jgi:hypothetical protein
VSALFRRVGERTDRALPGRAEVSRRDVLSDALLFAAISAVFLACWWIGSHA